jgi:hypothetical protein
MLHLNAAVQKGLFIVQVLFKPLRSFSVGKK